MIPCRQCGQPNIVSNKFCSQCGWANDPGDIQAGEAAVASDVAKGQRLFGENRISDALAMAQTALLADPDNVPALALKGDCLERSGDIEGALEAYEQVVTLRPDSPLDRIRVAQLRRIAMAPVPVHDALPDRRNSLFAAVAAFVLMAAAGSAFYLVNKKDKSTPEQTKFEPPANSAPFTSPAPVPTQAKPKVQDPVTEEGKAPLASTDNHATGPSNQNNGLDSRRVNAGRREPITGTTLPNTGDEGFQPVSPNIEAVPETEPKGTNTNSDPDPTPVQSSGDKKPPEKSERPPIIDIRPSKGSQKSVGGSQPREGSENEATTLIRVARQYFLAGEYDKAAKAYEKAIKLGASTASANHRLAQCYVNLRMRPEALMAYQRAMAAYQKMIQDGVGDKRLYESYIDECRQAIKLLQ